jgi:CheY-like chemotaxis protein
MSTRILVVEDDPTILQNVAQYLQSQGYEVKGVGEGTKALPLLEEPWDLLITDLMLPDVDGIELLQAAKRARPEAAVVVVTGFGSIESAVTAMKHGAEDYLTKPFRLAQLREVVERSIARVERERVTGPSAEAPASVTEGDTTAEVRTLWRRKDIQVPASFQDEFLWLPDRALVVFTGLAEARLWQFAVQMLSLRLQAGDGVVYATAGESPDTLPSRLAHVFPIRALGEVVALVDLASHWVRVDPGVSRVHVASLQEVSAVLLTLLNRHLLSFSRVTLMVDSLSTLCRLLEEREAFQFIHLLRGLTRESNVAVYAVVDKESLSASLQTGVEGLADVVISLEQDLIRDVVRYDVVKGAPPDRPRINEIKREGPFLVPVKPISRKYGYVRCTRCGEEVFLAFVSPASEKMPALCDRCSR